MSGSRHYEGVAIMAAARSGLPDLARALGTRLARAAPVTPDSARLWWVGDFVKEATNEALAEVCPWVPR